MPFVVCLSYINTYTCHVAIGWKNWLNSNLFLFFRGIPICFSSLYRACRPQRLSLKSRSLLWLVLGIFASTHASFRPEGIQFDGACSVCQFFKTRLLGFSPLPSPIRHSSPPFYFYPICSGRVPLAVHLVSESSSLVLHFLTRLCAFEFPLRCSLTKL